MKEDGDKLGKNCPECETELIFEMSFQDQFSHTSGHYTTDYPLAVCPNCDFYEDYEGEDYE